MLAVQPGNRTLYELVHRDDKRGPSEDFRMQFEALGRFNEQEKLAAKELLDSLILRHTANQLSAEHTAILISINGTCVPAFP